MESNVVETEASGCWDIPAPCKEEAVIAFPAGCMNVHRPKVEAVVGRTAADANADKTGTVTAKLDSANATDAFAPSCTVEDRVVAA
jgi:hypothetical protein